MITPAAEPTVALTHFAGRAGDHNDRAMVGSRLLAAALSVHYNVEPFVVGAPRPALSANWDVELEAARSELAQIRDRFRDVLGRGLAPVTALSRCAVALATVPAVAAHRPDAVVVWFDAHADVNIPADTATGYLGGLALSGPLGLWDSGLGSGLNAAQAILVGARDVDPPEAELIASSDLTVIPPGPDLARRLTGAVAGRPVYVHIDCDVLDPGIVPTDYVVPDGLTLDDLHDAAAALSRSEVVGVEIGELESATGDEDCAPLLRALGPVLEPLRRRHEGA